MKSNEPNNPLRFGFFNPSMAIAWMVGGTMGQVNWYWDEPFAGMMNDPDVDFQKARDELVQSIIAGVVDCSAIPENRKGEQGGRRVIKVAELQHTKIQYDDDGGLVLAKRRGGKFLKILLPAFQVCRNWPERVIVPYQSPIEADRNDRFTLFDAVAYLARHNDDGIEESEAFDACLDRLRDQLSRGEITATGIANDGFRYDIPSGVWEMARWGRSHTDPRTHRIEFIQPGLGNEPTKVGGTLTLHSRFKEKEPDWIDIRVPAEAIRAQVAKTLSKLSATIEAAGESDGGEIAVDYDETRGAPTIVSSAHQEEQGVLTFETIRARVAEDGGIAQLTPSWDATYRAIQSLWPRGEIVRKRKKRYEDIWGVTGNKDGPSDSTLDAFFRRYLPEIVRKKS